MRKAALLSPGGAPPATDSTTMTTAAATTTFEDSEGVPLTTELTEKLANAQAACEAQRVLEERLKSAEAAMVAAAAEGVATLSGREQLLASEVQRVVRGAEDGIEDASSQIAMTRGEVVETGAASKAASEAGLPSIEDAIAHVRLLRADRDRERQRSELMRERVVDRVHSRLSELKQGSPPNRAGGGGGGGAVYDFESLTDGGNSGTEGVARVRSAINRDLTESPGFAMSTDSIPPGTTLTARERLDAGVSGVATTNSDGGDWLMSSLRERDMVEELISVAQRRVLTAAIACVRHALGCDARGSNSMLNTPDISDAQDILRKVSLASRELHTMEASGTNSVGETFNRSDGSETFSDTNSSVNMDQLLDECGVIRATLDAVCDALSDLLLRQKNAGESANLKEKEREEGEGEGDEEQQLSTWQQLLRLNGNFSEIGETVRHTLEGLRGSANECDTAAAILARALEETLQEPTSFTINAGGEGIVADPAHHTGTTGSVSLSSSSSSSSSSLSFSTSSATKVNSRNAPSSLHDHYEGEEEGAGVDSELRLKKKHADSSISVADDSNNLIEKESKKKKTTPPPSSHAQTPSSLLITTTENVADALRDIKKRELETRKQLHDLKEEKKLLKKNLDEVVTERRTMGVAMQSATGVLQNCCYDDFDDANNHAHDHDDDDDSKQELHPQQAETHSTAPMETEEKEAEERAAVREQLLTECKRAAHAFRKIKHLLVHSVKEEEEEQEKEEDNSEEEEDDGEEISERTSKSMETLPPSHDIPEEERPLISIIPPSLPSPPLSSNEAKGERIGSAHRMNRRVSSRDGGGGDHLGPLSPESLSRSASPLRTSSLSGSPSHPRSPTRTRTLTRRSNQSDDDDDVQAIPATSTGTAGTPPQISAALVAYTFPGLGSGSKPLLPPSSPTSSSSAAASPTSKSPSFLDSHAQPSSKDRRGSSATVGGGVGAGGRRTSSLGKRLPQQENQKQKQKKQKKLLPAPRVASVGGLASTATSTPPIPVSPSSSRRRHTFPTDKTDSQTLGTIESVEDVVQAVANRISQLRSTQQAYFECDEKLQRLIAENPSAAAAVFPSFATVGSHASENERSAAVGVRHRRSSLKPSVKPKGAATTPESSQGASWAIEKSQPAADAASPPSEAAVGEDDAVWSSKEVQQLLSAIETSIEALGGTPVRFTVKMKPQRGAKAGGEGHASLCSSTINDSSLSTTISGEWGQVRVLPQNAAEVLVQLCAETGKSIDEVQELMHPTTFAVSSSSESKGSKEKGVANAAPRKRVPLSSLVQQVKTKVDELDEVKLQSHEILMHMHTYDSSLDASQIITPRAAQRRHNQLFAPKRKPATVALPKTLMEMSLSRSIVPQRPSEGVQQVRSQTTNFADHHHQQQQQQQQNQQQLRRSSSFPSSRRPTTNLSGTTGQLQDSHLSPPLVPPLRRRTSRSQNQQRRRSEPPDLTGATISEAMKMLRADLEKRMARVRELRSTCYTAVHMLRYGLEETPSSKNNQKDADSNYGYYSSDIPAEEELLALLKDLVMDVSAAVKEAHIKSSEKLHNTHGNDDGDQNTTTKGEGEEGDAEDGKETSRNAQSELTWGTQRFVTQSVAQLVQSLETARTQNESLQSECELAGKQKLFLMREHEELTSAFQNEREQWELQVAEQQEQLEALQKDSESRKAQLESLSKERDALVAEVGESQRKYVRFLEEQVENQNKLRLPLNPESPRRQTESYCDDDDDIDGRSSNTLHVRTPRLNDGGGRSSPAAFSSQSQTPRMESEKQLQLQIQEQHVLESHRIQNMMQTLMERARQLAEKISSCRALFRNSSFHASLPPPPPVDGLVESVLSTPRHPNTTTTNNNSNSQAHTHPFVAPPASYSFSPSTFFSNPSVLLLSSSYSPVATQKEKGDDPSKTTAVPTAAAGPSPSISPSLPPSSSSLFAFTLHETEQYLQYAQTLIDEVAHLANEQFSQESEDRASLIRRAKRAAHLEDDQEIQTREAALQERKHTLHMETMKLEHESIIARMKRSHEEEVRHLEDSKLREIHQLERSNAELRGRLEGMQERSAVPSSVLSSSHHQQELESIRQTHRNQLKALESELEEERQSWRIEKRRLLFLIEEQNHSNHNNSNTLKKKEEEKEQLEVSLAALKVLTEKQRQQLEEQDVELKAMKSREEELEAINKELQTRLDEKLVEEEKLQDAYKDLEEKHNQVVKELKETQEELKRNLLSETSSRTNSKEEEEENNASIVKQLEMEIDTWKLRCDALTKANESMEKNRSAFQESLQDAVKEIIMKKKKRRDETSGRNENEKTTSFSLLNLLLQHMKELEKEIDDLRDANEKQQKLSSESSQRELEMKDALLLLLEDSNKKKQLDEFNLIATAIKKDSVQLFIEWEQSARKAILSTEALKREKNIILPAVVSVLSFRFNENESLQKNHEKIHEVCEAVEDLFDTLHMKYSEVPTVHIPIGGGGRSRMDSPAKTARKSAEGTGEGIQSRESQSPPLPLPLPLPLPPSSLNRRLVDIPSFAVESTLLASSTASSSTTSASTASTNYSHLLRGFPLEAKEEEEKRRGNHKNPSPSHSSVPLERVSLQVEWMRRYIPLLMESHQNLALKASEAEKCRNVLTELCADSEFFSEENNPAKKRTNGSKNSKKETSAQKKIKHKGKLEGVRFAGDLLDYDDDNIDYQEEAPMETLVDSIKRMIEKWHAQRSALISEWQDAKREAEKARHRLQLKEHQHDLDCLNVERSIQELRALVQRKLEADVAAEAHLAQIQDMMDHYMSLAHGFTAEKRLILESMAKLRQHLIQQRRQGINVK